MATTSSSRNRAATALRGLVLAAAAVAAGASASPPQGNSMPTSIPPRDGDIAIQEELAAARRAGTLAAYDLFIARHPDHPFADTARRERERLARRGGR
jgi:hypothetical protein